jgi:outer membrane receptor protein involved in Fe transport
VASDLLAGPVRLEVRGQWQRHSLIELADESGVLNGGESPVFDLLLNTWTLDLLAHHARGQWLSGTAGVSGMLQDNDSRGPEPLVPDARMRSGAAFVFEEATLGAWSLLGGARVDRRRLAADANVDLALAAQRRDYAAATGDLGVIFRPAPPLALALNVGRAWRAPTLFELFANGPNEAEGRYEMGRADLQAETGVDADVSLRWRLPRLRGEVTGFRNAMSRFVYITPTASQIDGLQVYRYLQADALLSGFEAWTEVDAWRTLTLRARLDGVRGTNRDANEPLPLVPPLRYAGAAEWHAVDVGPLGRARLGVEVEHVTEQRRLNPLDIPTGAYTLLELTGGAEARLLGRGTRLDVTVRNAADVRYRSFLSRYKRFALDPGRNVVVRLSTVW